MLNNQKAVRKDSFFLFKYFSQVELLVKNDCVKYNKKYKDEKGLVLCTNLVKIISKLYIC